mgnify:CR=1 FL=1
MELFDEGLLKWSDILKIVIGFCISIALMWFKEVFETKRQIRSNKESLWEILTYSADFGLTSIVGYCDRLLDSLSKGTIKLAAIDIPDVLRELSIDLASLDSKNSYLFNEFASDLQLVKEGVLFLKSLQIELIKSRDCPIESGVNPEAIKRAMMGQCKILASDRIRLAEKEKKLILHLEKELGKGSKESDKISTSIKSANESLEKLTDKVVSALT